MGVKNPNVEETEEGARGRGGSLSSVGGEKPGGNGKEGDILGGPQGEQKDEPGHRPLVNNQQKS